MLSTLAAESMATDCRRIDVLKWNTSGGNGKGHSKHKFLLFKCFLQLRFTSSFVNSGGWTWMSTAVAPEGLRIKTWTIVIDSATYVHAQD